MTFHRRYFTAALCFGLILGGCTTATRETPPAPTKSQTLGIAPLLEKAGGYVFGQDRAPVTEAEAFISKAGPAAYASIERDLLLLIERQLPDGGRDFVLRSLARVASSASVPHLISLLGDGRWQSLALNALMQIPGPETDAALLKALTSSAGNARLGLVSALGRRHVSSAAPSLVLLTRSEDAGLAAAAINSLGSIGSAEALTSLLALPVSGKLEEARVRAIFAAASALAADRGIPSSLIPSTARLCRSVVASGSSSTLRLSALRTLLQVEGGAKEADLLGALADKSEDMALGAAVLLAQSGLPGLDKVLARAWNTLPTRVRIALVGGFAQNGCPGSRELALASLDAAEAELKNAAVRALGRVGTLGDADRLLALALGTGDTAEAAVASLSLLRDAEVSSLVRGRIGKSDALADAVLLRIASARADREVFPLACAAIEQGTAANAVLRQAALEAAGALAEPADLPRLISILSLLKETPEIRVLDKALPGIVLNHASASEAAKLLLAAMPSMNPAGRRALRSALAVLEAPEALAAFQAMAKSGTPEDFRDAVRAMGASRQFAHADLLFELASKAPQPSDRVLAARSLILLTSQSYGADWDKRINTFVSLWPHLDREDERKSLLSELGRMRPSVAKTLRPE